MKLVNLFLISLILVSCCNVDNDAVELSYEFVKNEHDLKISLYNNTKEDFVVIIPKIISFSSGSSSNDKSIESKSLEATLSDEDKTDISQQMIMINASLNKDSSEDDQKYFPTALLVKKKERKDLHYKFNKDFVVDKTYKSNFFKMRDVLNVPQNIDIIKEMINYRKTDHYRIYLDNFKIKDSLEVKF